MKKSTKKAVASGQIIEHVARQIRHTPKGEPTICVARRVWLAFSEDPNAGTAEQEAEWAEGFEGGNWHKLINAILRKFEVAGLIVLDGPSYRLAPQAQEFEL